MTAPESSTAPKKSLLEKTAWYLTAILGFGLAANAVTIAYIGTFDITYTRGLIVYVSVVATILGRPLAAKVDPSSGGLRAAAWLADIIAVAVFTTALLYFLSAAENLNNMLVSYGTTEILAAFGGIIVLLEATRRLFGLPLFLFIIAVFAYGLLGSYLPGILHHSGFSLSASMEMIWYGFQGVYGTPLSIVIQVVLIFIIFGVVLEGTGAANSLINIAFALTARTRGGVAHAAIVSSALFGSMSGSVVANVVGTGTFTIPMIVRRGFKPASAGAIEAAASTGGQIMPPVMGAAAFLMADLIGMSYLMICAAALVPALFYFGALFVSVSLDAGKSGIEPIPEKDRITLDRRSLIQSLMFVVPIISIIVVLLMGRSPAMAGFFAVIAAVVMGLILNPEFRRNPMRITGSIMRGGLAGASIIVAVAAIGIILGTLNLTGLGLSFASTVAALGDSNLLLALLLTAATCLILGMGMPTLPAYLIIVLVMGRSLRELGIEPLALHMFVFYFGVLSAITPPVAVAVFAASPIAKSHPLSTALAALRLAFIGFIIPFVFVVEPSLLLVTDTFEFSQFLVVVVALIVSIAALSTAFYGYDGELMGIKRRLMRMIVGMGPIIAILADTYEYLAIAGCTLWLVLDIVSLRSIRRAVA